MPCLYKMLQRAIFPTPVIPNWLRMGLAYIMNTFLFYFKFDQRSTADFERSSQRRSTTEVAMLYGIRGTQFSYEPVSSNMSCHPVTTRCIAELARPAWYELFSATA